MFYSVLPNPQRKFGAFQVPTGFSKLNLHSSTDKIALNVYIILILVRLAINFGAILSEILAKIAIWKKCPLEKIGIRSTVFGMVHRRRILVYISCAPLTHIWNGFSLVEPILS